jgi:hypothetical protein
LFDSLKGIVPDVGNAALYLLPQSDEIMDKIQKYPFKLLCGYYRSIQPKCNEMKTTV